MVIRRFMEESSLSKLSSVAYLDWDGRPHFPGVNKRHIDPRRQSRDMNMLRDD
jgi:hypothetical protein